jgi:hypothetical protein
MFSNLIMSLCVKARINEQKTPCQLMCDAVASLNGINVYGQ